MQKHYLLFFLAIIIAFTGCKSNKQTSEEKSFAAKTVVIPLPQDKLYLPGHLKTMAPPTMYSEGGKDYMIGYNHKIHALDIFNVTDKTVEQIPLEKEGPNGVNSLLNISYYKGAYLLGTTSRRYYLVNKEGKVMETYTFPALEDVYAKEYNGIKSPWMIMNLFTFFTFNPQKGEVAFAFYPKGMNEEPVKSPYLVEVYSFETGEIEEIEIPYPQKMKQRTNWGFLNDLNICLNGDLVIMNCPALSDVFVYNRKTKTLTEHAIPSRYIENILHPVDMGGGDGEALPLRGFYYPLRYDPHRNVYWRMQAGEADRPTSFDRTFSLIKISPDFSSYEEVLLPEDREDTHSGLLIGENGLWLNYATELAGEELWLFEIPLDVF
ncbi:DUF4221 domain-containing protein [Parabacteroides sp. OttesenSCG-928-G06]|nr:DUF4221 domain-containing protein [Parabacteroides sp. OttesenSCG-928-G06]